jgi:hypothetical protein
MISALAAARDRAMVIPPLLAVKICNISFQAMERVLSEASAKVVTCVTHCMSRDSSVPSPSLLLSYLNAEKLHAARSSTGRVQVHPPPPLPRRRWPSDV